MKTHAAFRSTLLWALAVVLCASLLTSVVALADESERNRRPVRLLTTIPIPGQLSALRAFDISWIDAPTQLYYLGDRSNASVDVVNARTNQFVKQIKAGFTGVVFKANPNGPGQVADNDRSGPNGVVVSGRWLFVTDANSRVVSIDLTTDQVVGDVSTGGAPGLRADELAYDPQHGILLVVNNADSPPFATLINVDKQTGKLTVGQRITFDDATNGAEQPVWVRATGRFYISIPEVNGPGDGTGIHGAVKKINPLTAVVEATFPVDLCQPAGLTLGPEQDLLLGCSVVFDTVNQVWSPTDANSAAPQQIIMDARNGSIDARVAGVGGSDEVWFNAGDGRYYTASRANPTGPVLGVIDAESGTLVQVVPTVNAAGKPTAVPPVPAGTAHSVAANPHNNHVFVPLPANNVFPDCLNGCVAVFGVPQGEDDD